MIRQALKVIGSYLAPRTIEKAGSKYNPYLEVAYAKGKLRLNSRTINYSEEGVHAVFAKAFEKFNISQRKINNVLVLGFGSGGVASLLRDQYKMDCPITGVEIDPVVIDLARKHFGLNEMQGLTLHVQDAYDFTMNCSHRYDLITMDAFIDKNVPAKFHEPIFVKKLASLLKEDGILFFNYISIDDRTESGLQKILRTLKELPGTATRYPVSVLGVGNVVLVYDSKVDAAHHFRLEKKA